MPQMLFALWALTLMVAGVRVEAAVDPATLLSDAQSMPGFLPLY